MKRIKTSAIMRAIVADASRPGEQRDAAVRVLNRGRRVTWRALYDEVPHSMAEAAGWSQDDLGWLLVWNEPRRIKAVHDALVALAWSYGIQPTEDA